MGPARKLTPYIIRISPEKSILVTGVKAQLIMLGYADGMQPPWRFRRTTLLMVASTGLLVGLAYGRKWPEFSLSWLLLCYLVFGLSLFRIPGLLVISCILAGLSTGWWRGAVFRKQIMPYEDLYGRQLIVQVTAKTDGVYSVQTGNLGFDAGEVRTVLPASERLPGVLKIETIGLPAVFRGDRLEIAGKLYPAGGSKQGSIKFAQARVLERNLIWLEKLRLRFNASLQSVLPEPQASFGLGILVGQRTTLPKDVNDQLSKVGLTHIIAVSGYNLTIIIRFLGKRLGRSKFQTLALSFLLIGVFVLITGFSASIVRAAIVSILSLGAWHYGRVIKPVLVLLLSGVLTAGWYPVYIWSDIGWYLSFLAFFGVLVLAPLITAYFWKGQDPKALTPLVIESACAQVMAAPLIMYIFKETSLIALPANMLVVPLVPLAMLLAFIGGIAGIFLPALAAWIAWPAQVLLAYMLSVVNLMSRLPYAVWQQGLPLPYMLTFYGLIGLLCVLLWKKTKPNMLK